MTTIAPGSVLPATLQVGAPDVCGPLAVYPLSAALGELEYIALAEALARGAVVSELPNGASVNDLLVRNPLDVPVLLFEGEHVSGAQQDRTVDASVLVAARSDLAVAVSCVEHGRWDGSRHGEAFGAAPSAAHPELRRRKNAALLRAAAAQMPLRADQREVWDEVADKHRRLGTTSGTGALHDAFAGRRDRVAELAGAMRRRDGQVGAIATVDGTPVCLDLVSRPDVWAALHGALVQGYALDAAESTASSVEAPAPDEISRWMGALHTQLPQLHPSPGLGQSLVIDGPVAATGLWHEGELVQLSAYPAEPGRAPRVRRPSRRRPR